MTKNKTFWVGIVAAAALALTGCGDDATGTGSITAVHLAPEVPAAGMTDVTVYVNGEAAAVIAYGESTGRVDLAAGEDYAIGLGTAETELLTLDPFTMPEGADLVAVAYRTNDEPPVGVWVVDIATEGLVAGSGRVFVGHGANDSLLNPVDIIVTDEGACPEPLLDQFAFGTMTAPGDADLPAATYNLGFDLDPGDCTAEVEFSAPVAADLSTIVVAVDEDTTDESLDPQVWAIVDASAAPVSLIAE